MQRQKRNYFKHGNKIIHAKSKRENYNRQGDNSFLY